ncbi:hypothetical protein LCGC14_0275900 [marine sediment metagenome]|uniref:Uncharacterized protein n=1 Tax=marine sediment metagenome TaxID=412755 RepID=A0A0F9X2V5_9ZZZZ
MRQCTKTESIDCQRLAEADYQIAELENEIALLKLEKGGISDGYSRVKAELDLRKGLKPGHVIVKDKPDMDIDMPDMNMYSHLDVFAVYLPVPTGAKELREKEDAYDALDKLIDQHMEALQEDMGDLPIRLSASVANARSLRQHSMKF